MKRDPRVTRMQADLTSSLGKEQRLRALFIAMIVQTLDQPRCAPATPKRASLIA